MTRWHRTRRGDLGLRALGLGVSMISCSSIGHLVRLHAVDPVDWHPGIPADLLAAIGFLCGSAGAALTLLGAHLFDEVQVSEHWRPKPPAGRGTNAAGPARIASAADAASAGASSSFAAPRADRAPDRFGHDPLAGRAMVSVASCRRPEDRGDFGLAPMMPVPEQARR